jgi:alkylated DNA repair dioxygenase AlkB
MELFQEEFSAEKNYLPYDGIVNYYGKIITEAEAEKYYSNLLSEIEWKNDEAVIFGKLIYTKRKVAWYAVEGFEYTYSNRTKKALKFTQDLLYLRNLVEVKTGETYNSCLLNLYHSGEEGMAYHSDGERDLKENGAIASLSLGAKRKFSFKHKVSKERVDFILEPGSLLVMKGETQKNWLHRLPPTKLVKTPRINLTFRSIEH